MVDNKKLQFTVAVDISYIDKEMQKWIYEYIKDNGFIKPNQIAVLRKRLEDENVGHNYMISIFNNCIAPKGSTIPLFMLWEGRWYISLPPAGIISIQWISTWIIPMMITRWV